MRCLPCWTWKSLLWLQWSHLNQLLETIGERILKSIMLTNQQLVLQRLLYQLLSRWLSHILIFVTLLLLLFLRHRIDYIDISFLLKTISRCSILIEVPIVPIKLILLKSLAVTFDAVHGRELLGVDGDVVLLLIYWLFDCKWHVKDL